MGSSPTILVLGKEEDMSDVHEIADGIYRISNFDGNSAPVEFSQFLIKDEKPLLFHTGSKGLFPQTLEAVKQVVDPASLSYISWSHLESDECGALNEFLAAAPKAEPVHGQIGVMLSVQDFFDRPVRGLGDEEVLDLGRKKLRFLITPHVPHAWDAILVFEETTGTLFCSDLFTVFGKPPAVTESDVIEQSMTALKQLPGYLPVGPHTGAVFDRLVALQPQVLAGHHSSAYTGDAVRALEDLRGELFKFAGLAVEEVATGDGDTEPQEPYG
jgi:glyoxylase-like metal-dependent hydrolase (beta-lactamase superfamily II)